MDGRSMSEGKALSDWAVQVAVTPAERDRVFRFRYDSYAVEHGRWPSPGQTTRRMLREAADEKASLFFVEFETRVVATLRLRIGPLPTGLIKPSTADLIPPVDAGDVALADGIIVSRIFRKASLLESMVETVCDSCGDLGIRYLFCHLRPEAARLLESLGFGAAGPATEDPELGARVLVVKGFPAEQDGRRSWQSLFEAATGIDPGGMRLLVNRGA